MNRNVVVSCAVTGSGDSVGKHPAIPVTPEEISYAAIEAAKAGAAIVHLHVRDPDTGKASRRADLFGEVSGAFATVTWTSSSTSQPAWVEIYFSVPMKTP